MKNKMRQGDLRKSTSISGGECKRLCLREEQPLRRASSCNHRDSGAGPSDIGQRSSEAMAGRECAAGSLTEKVLAVFQTLKPTERSDS